MSLWKEQDSTRVFDGRARLYELGRPGYPQAAVDFLLDGLGEPASVRVADIGAGTARLARMFVAAGCDTVAVEPNAEMRAAAPRLDGLEWRDATAEQTGLAEGSVDLVTIAQALHWLDPERALPELRRILRPQGRLAVVWNDRLKDSPFEADYHELLREMKPADRKDGPPKSSIDILSGTRWFEDPQQHEFRHAHRMDLKALTARTLSLSYAPKPGGGQGSLRELLELLHAKHAAADGCVELGYCTIVHSTQAKS